MQEFADVGVSVKGTHYPPGKEPKEGGERKLYLLLQAHDEISLRRAKDEIIRIMRETLRQMVILMPSLSHVVLHSRIRESTNH